MLIVHLSMSLFMNTGEGGSTTSKIDLTLKTAFSSIFGYILSSNFISNRETKEVNEVNEVKETAQIKNIEQNTKEVKEISTNVEIVKSDEKLAPYTSVSEKNIQVFIIGTLAIFTIAMLFYARHFCDEATLSPVGLAQMRDVCVTSIGFLIGYVDL